MNDPLKPVIDIIEVQDGTMGSPVLSWDVRVGFTTTRHGGKLIANCPTLKLAELVKDGILMLAIEDGVSWDIEFEVNRPPTPILVTDTNYHLVFPTGGQNLNDERNPE